VSNVDEVEEDGEAPEDDRRASGSQGKRLRKFQANIYQILFRSEEGAFSAQSPDLPTGSHTRLDDSGH
jgi:hypothetical protein